LVDVRFDAFLSDRTPSGAAAMPDQPAKSDADRTLGSIKEAIGKITGDRKAIREGAAEKIAAAADTPEAS
jgi:uncharacterized protein YjbJ (UPF0337 family)